MKSRFGTRVFVTAAGTGAAAALAAAVLTAWPLRQDVNRRLEERLRRDAELAADLIEARGARLSGEDLDAEADRLGKVLGVRVTLVTTNGQLVGDSALEPAEFASADIARGQEVLDAARRGQGVDRRRDVRGIDTIFVASRADHPEVAYVRVAAPALTTGAQLTRAAPWLLLAIALAVALAFGGARAVSQPLLRRVRALVGVAERYVRGDFTREPNAYGDDELGVVARSFDGAVHATVRRLDDLAGARARMEAILAGMTEGVLVLDEQGRITLANDAVARIFGVESVIGRHHTDVIRHPDIVAQVEAGLRGETPAGVEFALGPEPLRHFVSRIAPARTGRDTVMVVHEITDLRRAGQASASGS